MEEQEPNYREWLQLYDSNDPSTFEKFNFLTNEMREIIKENEEGVRDLKGAIVAVEQRRVKSSVSPAELKLRKEFVQQMEAKLSEMRTKVFSTKVNQKMQRDARQALMKNTNGGTASDRFSKMESAVQQDNQAFIEQQQQQQQMMQDNQDIQLAALSKGLTQMKEHAIIIDGAITEQTEIIAQIDHEADKANAGLRGAMRKLNKLMDQANDTTQWTIMIVLIIVLVVLIVLVFYL
eukprot:TRINITY_DN1842_c0_g1_i1.p1 TRINITY_DN1842_c0_g1~~TRINITY_DN1842_c0_g1_i1.p1  ORF type:complete len:254 (+),score=56.50 TRINITY_DN1842_c0_g1_i1:60-764(+)